MPTLELATVWPIVLVVLGNVVYQICSKSIPADVHPLAAVAVVYAIGTVVTIIMYHVINRGGNLLREFSGLNWAPFALGVVVVALEVGFMSAYRAGWPVSSTLTMVNAFVAVILLAVGYLLLHEEISATKLIGVAI
ncbi:MAG: hypothetical protein IKG69_10020 [Atopobiaceae bacterium]|nr:hypothetical protein [Atopobiaceae bacterium]